jgi:hypothetical protein
MVLISPPLYDGDNSMFCARHEKEYFGLLPRGLLLTRHFAVVASPRPPAGDDTLQYCGAAMKYKDLMSCG